MQFYLKVSRIRTYQANVAKRNLNRHKHVRILQNHARNDNPHDIDENVIHELLVSEVRHFVCEPSFVFFNLDEVFTLVSDANVAVCWILHCLPECLFWVRKRVDLASLKFKV
jgi:hypothetical protein